jgi:hypothetical protein
MNSSFTCQLIARFANALAQLYLMFQHFQQTCIMLWRILFFPPAFRRKYVYKIFNLSRLVYFMLNVLKISMTLK